MESILPLVIFAIEEAVKREPQIETELRELFSKPKLTAQDWADFRAKVKSKGYFDYVPASALNAGK